LQNIRRRLNYTGLSSISDETRSTHWSEDNMAG